MVTANDSFACTKEIHVARYMMIIRVCLLHGIYYMQRACKVSLRLGFFFGLHILKTLSLSRGRDLQHLQRELLQR